jgi:hypothetical protein
VVQENPSLPVLSPGSSPAAAPQPLDQEPSPIMAPGPTVGSDDREAVLRSHECPDSPFFQGPVFSFVTTALVDEAPDPAPEKQWPPPPSPRAHRETMTLVECHEPVLRLPTQKEFPDLGRPASRLPSIADAVALAMAKTPEMVYAIRADGDSFQYRTRFRDGSCAWVRSAVLSGAAPQVVIDFMHARMEAYFLFGLS